MRVTVDILYDTINNARQHFLELTQIYCNLHIIVVLVAYMYLMIIIIHVFNVSSSVSQQPLPGCTGVDPGIDLSDHSTRYGLFLVPVVSIGTFTLLMPGLPFLAAI